MSSLFGGVRRRAAREDRAVDSGFRRRLARDINDAGSLDTPQRIRRGRHWTWFAVAAAALAGLALAAHGDPTDVPLTPDCHTPGIAVASSRVDAGAALHYRLTGPDDVPYAVTLDGAPAGPGTVRLTGCASAPLSLTAPAAEGPHRLAMLAVDPDGTTRQVTAVTITVTR
jgi:hypothetical protein